MKFRLDLTQKTNFCLSTRFFSVFPHCGTPSDPCGYESSKINATVDCETCDSGFHLEETDDSSIGKVCVVNVCNPCVNGPWSEEGVFCEIDGGRDCQSCDSGFFLVSGSCSPFDDVIDIFCDNLDRFFFEQFEDCDLDVTGDVILPDVENNDVQKFEWVNKNNPVVKNLTESHGFSHHVSYGYSEKSYAGAVQGNLVPISSQHDYCSSINLSSPHHYSVEEFSGIWNVSQYFSHKYTNRITFTMAHREGR